ncbi:MAG: SLBB domain-containing protein [Gammaproteobacteria bacterium]|nr:SLBB domain-containing protein [Gammaproteobacteria bacterium]
MKSGMGALAVITALLFLLSSHAPAQVPTPEQLQLLGQLPAEQQRALLGQYRQQGQADQPLVMPAASQPRAAEPIDATLAAPGDTVLLTLATAGMDANSAISPELRARTDELVARALAANPYRLERDGRIRIPGLPEPIPLAGLNAEEATTRLQNEPAFRAVDVGLVLLKPTPLGTDALKPFGYDIFRNVPSTFAQVSDVPVPPDYTIGPGDALELQFLGNVKGLYTLTVARDGRIRLPEIGPMAVAGMRFAEMQEAIETSVAEQMIGTRVSVGMGSLRSLQVMITGDAEKPGAYTVGGLSTASNALMAAGGVKPIGSLRRVRVLRGGRTAGTLDLYDLLLRGDSSGDLRLQSGDVVFVPPIGDSAGITGEVRRPARYEFAGAATAGALVELGGGLTEAASPASATIERIDPARGRIVLNVDLGSAEGRATRLRNGDVLHIPVVRDVLNDSVLVAGHVHQPGAHQYRRGLRLTQVLGSIEALKPNADADYVLVRRELAPDRRIEVHSASLGRALRNPGGEDDLLLAPRDRILVFDLGGSREPLLRPLLDELQRQSTLEAPAGMVTIGGSVRMPGEYPLEPGMTVADLVRAGASLSEAAFGGEAELARYEVVGGQSRKASVVSFDIAAALRGDPQADLPLQAFDILTVKRTPQWDDQEFVSLEGEVRFPGRYPIRRGETLTTLIARAGGLTDQAFPAGAVFTREALKEREAQQISSLAERLERDLALLAVQSAQAGKDAAGVDSLAAGQSLLAELRRTKPVGRLAIDLPSLLRESARSADDIVLRDADRLRIPRRIQEVTVMGEVQSGTSQLYQAGLTRDDYIDLSGGLTQKADKRRIYVVRANGQVAAASTSRWLPSGRTSIQPGDTIVVPVDAERLPPLPLWTSVTSIIYNLAVAVAAVNSF